MYGRGSLDLVVVIIDLLLSHYHNNNKKTAFMHRGLYISSNIPFGIIGHSRAVGKYYIQMNEYLP